MDFGFDWDVWTVRMVCECGGDERIHCLSLCRCLCSLVVRWPLDSNPNQSVILDIIKTERKG
jgi:hypothetical protein